MKQDLSKVLITGGTGMLGSYVDFGVKTNDHTLDVTDLESIRGACKKYSPKVILHLAAETDVDKCERDPKRAYLVNAVGTYNAALAAREIGAKLFYISTIGVFDGEKQGPYTENDPPNPINHYGHSKLLGELAIESLLKDYCILRVCWMMGGGPERDKKFIAKIIHQLFTGAKEIKAITDQIGAPTFGKDVVKAIKILLEKDQRGIVHFPNKSSASRFEVAKYIVDYFKPGVPVIAVEPAYFNLNAVRTKNETFSSKLNLDFVRPWQEALKEYLDTEWKGYLEK